MKAASLVADVHENLKRLKVLMSQIFVPIFTPIGK
jgi:hypothetical protein